MAWRQLGDKPLSEPMMVRLPTHIYASLGLSKLSTNPVHIRDKNMAMTLLACRYPCPKGAHCSAVGRSSVDYRILLYFCLTVSFNLVEQISLFKWPTITHESRHTAIFNPSLTTISHLHYPRDLFRYAPSPWETSLHCNDVSHWLGAYLDSSLLYRSCWSILRSHIVMKSAPHISWLLLTKPSMA